MPFFCGVASECSGIAEKTVRTAAVSGVPPCGTSRPESRRTERREGNPVPLLRSFPQDAPVAYRPHGQEQAFCLPPAIPITAYE